MCSDNDKCNTPIDVSDIISSRKYTSPFNKEQSTREIFLKRKLARLKEMEAELDKKYTGNERKYTFHAGFDLGYIVGKISAYEDIVDLFDIDIN